MKRENSDVIELVKVVYEQHWLHARHVENERLWFTNIFTAIFAGVISIIKDSLFDLASVPLILFLMILSIFGILVSIKFDSIYKTHKRAAELILEMYNLSHINAQFNKHWVNNLIRISKLFPFFFAMCFSFLMGVLIYIYLRNSFFSITVPTITAMIFLVSLYKLNY